MSGWGEGGERWREGRKKGGWDGQEKEEVVGGRKRLGREERRKGTKEGNGEGRKDRRKRKERKAEERER